MIYFVAGARCIRTRSVVVFCKVCHTVTFGVDVQ